MSTGSHVVIIGAGAAGLAAGLELVKANRSVRIVEARARIGGRVWTVLEPGQPPLEYGAEFLHGRNPRLQALIKRARLHPGVADGPHKLLIAGRLVGAMKSFEAAARLFAHAHERRQTVDAFLKGRAHGTTLKMARAYVEGFYAARTDVASAWAIGEMTREADGESIRRVREGYGSVLVALRDEFLAKGGELQLASVVHAIHWRRRNVRLQLATPAGTRLSDVEGERLLITVPASVLGAPSGEGAFRIVPELTEKRRAAKELTSGAIVKVLIRLREPITRAAFVHAPGLAFPVFWRPLPFEHPILVGWAAGPEGDALHNRKKEDVLEIALRCLSKFFRRKIAELETLVEDFRVIDWKAEPFSRGGYAVFRAKAEDAAAVLKQPVEDTLFFAGEATNLAHAGTVHGALESGAQSVQALLPP